jgi:tRNA modification GTPase
MTIYALSSGPGISGVAVIRISGVNAANVVKKLTKSKLPKPRVATLKKFSKNGQKKLIDEGIVIWFPAPNSYTGEDLAEFHVHGSIAVVKAIHLEISKIKNCRLAEPGEFTKRAFQNGKINLLKAESIGDLISSIRDIQKISNGVLFEIKKTLNDQKVGERIRDGFKIAIVGPPNSGKSSLLNYLSKRDAAIVSETAGTTRDVIETHLNLDGYPVIVSDTAGIRTSKNEIEKKGIKIALKRAEDADLRLVILSAKSIDFTGV